MVKGSEAGAKRKRLEVRKLRAGSGGRDVEIDPPRPPGAPGYDSTSISKPP